MVALSSTSSSGLSALLGKPIAFHRIYVQLAGSITAALMLSQAVYWSQRPSQPDGSFWKTTEEWEEETGLSRREQDTARKALRRLPFWYEKRRGIPAKMFYRVDLNGLFEFLQTRLADQCKPDCTNPPNKSGGNRRTNTETTSETTSENISSLREDVGSKLPPCPHEKIISLYHELLPELPRVREWNKTRRGYLQARWKEHPDITYWAGLFKYVAKSDFLTGRVNGRDGKPPFLATLEWITRPNNFAKIVEGNYHWGAHK